MDSCVGGCLSGQRSLLTPGRVTALTLIELGHLHREGVVDLHRPLRKQGQQLGGDTGDLSLTLNDFPEPDPVPVSEFGAQHRLIETTQRALVTFQHPRVQRQPTAIAGLHLARDHQMGVQLRIIRPARGLPEPGHDQTL